MPRASEVAQLRAGKALAKRMERVLALVALLVALPPREARAVSDAAAQDDEALDDSSEGLDENEMYGEAPGQPIEFGRRRRWYRYELRPTQYFWDSERVWCLCELPGTERTLFDPDELKATTEEERNACLLFGVGVGSVVAGGLAALALAAESPAALAAMAATPTLREFIFVVVPTMGGILGGVIAFRLCPKPDRICPTCPPGWNGQCPCDCPPCYSPPCPPCPCPPPCCPPDVICKEGEL